MDLDRIERKWKIWSYCLTDALASMLLFIYLFTIKTYAWFVPLLHIVPLFNVFIVEARSSATKDNVKQTFTLLAVFCSLVSLYGDLWLSLVGLYGSIACSQEGYRYNIDIMPSINACDVSFDGYGIVGSIVGLYCVFSVFGTCAQSWRIAAFSTEPSHLTGMAIVPSFVSFISSILLVMSIADTSAMHGYSGYRITSMLFACLSCLVTFLFLFIVSLKSIRIPSGSNKDDVAFGGYGHTFVGISLLFNTISLIILSVWLSRVSSTANLPAGVCLVAVSAFSCVSLFVCLFIPIHDTAVCSGLDRDVSEPMATTSGYMAPRGMFRRR